MGTSSTRVGFCAGMGLFISPTLEKIFIVEACIRVKLTVFLESLFVYVDLFRDLTICVIDPVFPVVSYD